MAAENAKRTRIARYAKEGVSMEEIAEKIAKKFGLAEGEIMKRGKNNSRSEARKACAYVLNRYYEIPVIQIARYFNISSPAVSTMVAEGQKAAKLIR
jgi:chromosomal replication initiation ATPase DnaA